MDVKLCVTAWLALIMCFELSHANVSYVRWGRTECPAGEIALYKGYVVSHHVRYKGGSSYLCAADKPKFVRAKPGHQDYAGLLYGVEFQISDAQSSLFITDNLNGGTVDHQDVVCVRCYIQDASDVFMLPGRDDCYSSGYQLEYKGFLTSEINWGDHADSTDVICVDEAPEGRTGGQGADYQGIMYPVEFGCGSLPCNPYTDYNEATCAVCSY